MKKLEHTITDLIPDDWFSNHKNGSIWITGYKIIHNGALARTHIFDFSNARVIILHGELTYPQVTGIPNLEIKNDVARITGLKFDNFKAPAASYLIILQPYIIDGAERPEYEVKKDAGIIAALYTVINGYNMTYERTFDFHCSLDGRTSCSSPIIINPGAFPNPDLSDNRLKQIHNLGKKLDTMQPQDKNRVKLALHWFEQGLRSTGIDGFIKHWVAIETLAMPNETNVRPINESLAKIYGCNLKDASEKFGVGRIQCLRSRILHNGEDLSIHQDLSRYIEALFFDLLLVEFKVYDTGRAGQILKNTNFDLKKLTHTS